ncbi:hypothetical protein JRO89_XS02G0210300 [Xanthoceras sorbifolium]|uniref:RNase H type-1 domain-containing protein n=1 Tax=Xanthoceras sorbifolium TaxID=99658 RepID=A0ABQ8IGL5_9ROSI|nr:hypothetical protein JRO89_XS02G0210300 [Xanthoceras sorbifolium]
MFFLDGKEILVKAVIQSIPTYAVSLFKFPSMLIRELHALSAHFLWGSGGSQSKIHRHSEDMICCSKDYGGLGFQDLELFDQTLLAKQCLGVIHNHSSATKASIKPIIVETDCLSILRNLRDNRFPLSKVGSVLEDISKLLDSCSTDVPIFVPRSANQRAHSIQFGCSIDELSV